MKQKRREREGRREGGKRRRGREEQEEEEEEEEAERAGYQICISFLGCESSVYLRVVQCSCTEYIQ